jgi:hypothetical protein
LQQYGCTVQAGIGGTGVVGVLSNGDGPTVLLAPDLAGDPPVPLIPRGFIPRRDFGVFARARSIP